MAPIATPAMPPAIDMLRLLGGFQTSQALYTVARSGIADLLTDGPRPLAEVAGAVGMRPDLLRRLVAALAVEGVFTLDPAADLVALAPLGRTLARDTPESVRNVALMWMETHYLPFAELSGTLASGVPAAERALGRPFFDWLAQEPAAVETFSGAMADLLRVVREDALAAVDLSGVRTVVDIGGADGEALAKLALRHPELRGTVFDLPHVVTGAAEVLDRHGVAGRIGAEGGDFFTAVPAGADCYLACFVLHDWNDDLAARILDRVHEAAADGARLILVESVLDVGAWPHLATLMDLTMMAMFGGRERGSADWRALLASSGFRLDRILATRGPMCVVEAVREP